jgi:hypothetical protein
MTRRRVNTIPTNTQRHRPTMVYQQMAVGKSEITFLKSPADLTTVAYDPVSLSARRLRTNAKSLEPHAPHAEHDHCAIIKDYKDHPRPYFAPARIVLLPKTTSEALRCRPW